MTSYKFWVFMCVCRRACMYVYLSVETRGQSQMSFPGNPSTQVSETGSLTGNWGLLIRQGWLARSRDSYLSLSLPQNRNYLNKSSNSMELRPFLMLARQALYLVSYLSNAFHEHINKGRMIYFDFTGQPWNIKSAIKKKRLLKHYYKWFGSWLCALVNGRALGRQQTTRTEINSKYNEMKTLWNTT